jgi:hypothetical protein
MLRQTGARKFFVPFLAFSLFFTKSLNLRLSEVQKRTRTTILMRIDQYIAW